MICFTQRVYGASLNFWLILQNRYASPGIVIAIGVITTIVYWIKKLFNYYSYLILIALDFLFQALILIFAYLIRFLAVAFNPIEAQ